MEFTWEQMFKLVKRIWDVNQNNIAVCLNVHRSTISNLINNRQKRFSLNPYDIYRDLFDPSNPKSLAHSQNTRDLLNAVKQEIEAAGLTDATKGLPHNDYKELMMGLLKLAKKNEPPKTQSSHTIHQNVFTSQKDSQNTFSGAQLSIPQDCKICFYCENWDGNVHDANKTKTGVHGRCAKYNKDVLSTKSKCVEFKENWERIAVYQSKLLQKLL